MSPYAQRLRDWIERNGVDAEVLRFDESVRSVEQAVAASGHPVERITKSIVMVTHEGGAVVAVVPARSRASTDRVRKALALAARPRIATPEETESLLGQQVGGNSPLNAGDAEVLVDPLVLEMDWFITGGGDDRSLVRIAVAELRRVVAFTEARVRK